MLSSISLKYINHLCDELSMRRIVRATNCPCDELSVRRIVHATNCPCDELSMRRIVRATNCPCDELSVRRIVHATNCPRRIVRDELSVRRIVQSPHLKWISEKSMFFVKLFSIMAIRCHLILIVQLDLYEKLVMTDYNCS